MSVNCLKSTEGFYHTIRDDLESIFYVVMYCALRWLPLRSAQEDVGKWMVKFFDEHHQTLGGDEGGLIKHSYMTDEVQFSAKFNFKNDDINAFFKDGFEKLWTNQASFDRRRNQHPLAWTAEGLRELFKTVRSAKLLDNDKEDNDIYKVYQSHVHAPYAFRPTSSWFPSGIK